MYKGGPFVAFTDRIYITLSEKGKLLLNRNAHALIGKPQCVLLYYNRRKDTIGVRAADYRLAEAFPVHETGESAVVYAGNFCRHFGIKLSGTKKFILPEVTDEGILVLDLSSTVSVGGWRRKTKDHAKLILR